MAMFAPFSFRDAYALSDEWADWLARALSQKERTPLQPSPEGLEEAGSVLSAHGILPLLYVRLRDDPAWSSLTPEFRAALAAAFQSNAARSFLLEDELVRIGQACRDLGLLKGSALGRTVYDDPSLRPVSDFDLLVRREAVSDTQSALESLGYRAVGIAGDRHIGPWVRRYRAELPLVADVAGVGRLLVELHWALVEAPYYVERIAPADLRQGASPAPGLPQFFIPRPPVLLAHACAHLAMHHSRDLRLIWLVDIDRLASSTTMDWDEVVRIAEKWKLGHAIHTCLAVVSHWLGTITPAEVAPALARSASDPISAGSWGIGDETKGRAWRRAMNTLTILRPTEALRYAAWLGMRTALRPLEGLLAARQERAR